MDAKQLSLLFRFTLVKCCTGIVFCAITPVEYTLRFKNIAQIKTLLFADAFIGPVLRYLQPYNTMRRFFARFLDTQDMMNSIFVADAQVMMVCGNKLKQYFGTIWVCRQCPDRSREIPQIAEI